MPLAQRNEDVAILRANAARVRIGAVDARNRLADIVEDGGNFTGWNGGANGGLNGVELGRRLLDPRAHRRTNMDADLAGIDRGEEIAPQKWHQR